jgi:hypothetical protein
MRNRQVRRRTLQVPFLCLSMQMSCQWQVICMQESLTGSRRSIGIKRRKRSDELLFVKNEKIYKNTTKGNYFYQFISNLQ